MGARLTLLERARRRPVRVAVAALSGLSMPVGTFLAGLSLRPPLTGPVMLGAGMLGLLLLPLVLVTRTHTAHHEPDRTWWVTAAGATAKLDVLVRLLGS